VPDHSRFSKNRHGRFRERDVFRHVFETTVRRCMSDGLGGGGGFAVESSVLEADASRYHGLASLAEVDWSDPTRQSRAVREDLAARDPEPAPERKAPNVISPSDPCSAWTAKANMRVQFGYGLNYLIDTANAVIVDVAATPARTYDEVAVTRTMLERTQARLALKPNRLAADTAYGTGKFLGFLKAQRIAPHMPVWNKAQRTDGTVSRSDLTYDAERDVYTCPAGKTLRSTGRVSADNTRRHLASVPDCSACPLKPRCCPNTIHRKVTRDVHEDAPG
jgi:hypothetical protein